MATAELPEPVRALAGAAPHVAIVAEHASSRFGGEASLPLHYFRVLRERGVPVWLVVHARTRDELQARFPGETRILYVEDSALHLAMWRASHGLPRRIEFFTTGWVMRLATQWTQRRIVRRLIDEQGVNLVHQPIPVSPKEPSLLFGLGVPVVIGPMNGGIDFPPAFRRLQGPAVTAFLAAGRRASGLVNRLMPGKLKADLLLVANERTRRALPGGCRGRVLQVVENGVDLALWRPSPAVASTGVHFVFMGRLVDWKAVDLLVRAFAVARTRATVTLTIAGDGPERAALEQACRAAGVRAASPGEPGGVWFAGWLAQADCARLLQQADALVLPSLMECGGAVVLEAMAAAKPVIATDWGGPPDYLDASCGILVRPESADALVAQLAEAMLTLAADAALRAAMGRAGRAKVEREFDWNVKVDQVMALYRGLLAHRR